MTFLGNMKRHIKAVHDKIKDIKCDKCDAVFFTKCHLKDHVKAVHDKTKDIKCNKCDFVCYSNGGLKLHTKAVHDKTKDIKCDFCNYVCSRNGIMKAHIKRKHDKIKDYKCDKCEYACPAKRDLQLHTASIHERPIMDKHMSLGEYAISNYFITNNIVFEKEKKFFALKSPKGNLLRYDFYVAMHNLLIEFDGKQHFQKVRWTSMHTDEQIDERYNYIVECDNLKNEYADFNKIKLYRIKYTDIKILITFSRYYYHNNETCNNTLITCSNFNIRASNKSTFEDKIS